MDPLDREKPWGALGQFVLIAIVIGLIYFIFRVAVVIPEWGWQVVTLATVVGVILYSVLAFRGEHGRKPDAPPKPKQTAAQAMLRTILAIVLVVALTLPIWVVLYFMWMGGQLGR